MINATVMHGQIVKHILLTSTYPFMVNELNSQEYHYFYVASRQRQRMDAHTHHIIIIIIMDTPRIIAFTQDVLSNVYLDPDKGSPCPTQLTNSELTSEF